MNFNHDTGSIDTLQTLDMTTLPPLGGTAGVLTFNGTGALVIPNGTTAQQPTGVAAMLRFNSTVPQFEGYNGTSWVKLDQQGTVTSVAATTTSTGLTISGSPITTSGTLTFTLGTELQGLAALAGTGILVRTGAGTYSQVTVTGTANNIVISNGSGVAGNPTINLAAVGTPVTGAFVDITTDSFGRVTATSAVTSTNITTALGYTPVNKVGDSMSGNLTMTGGATVTGLPSPVNGTDAANKAYVDGTASSLDVHSAVEFATTASNVYTATYANGTAGVGATLTNAGTQAAFSIDGSTPVVGDRVLIKNQTAAVQNGIYTVTTVGTGATNWVLTRAIDANNSIVGQVHAGMFVFVAAGASLGNTGWVEVTIGTGTNEATIIGTDNQTWTQFSGAGTYTTTSPVTLTGSVFSLNGISGYGSGNGVLGANAGATALEYKTVTAGTGVSVSNAAGSITIANTGVLSFSAGSTGLTPSSATTGAVTLAGTLAVANGGTGLTTTPVNGALDIGNGAGFTRTTLTQGSGITITNGSGSITVANSGLLSIANSTGSTGLTLTFTTTSGAVTDVLAGTLVTANGGTGLTSIGTANQILGVNTGATGLEYKTVTAGTGISVSNAAGSITINNTGVTSVGLSMPSIFAVSGSPITTSGTFTVTLATEAANVIFAGPSTGAAAAPTFRSLVYADLPIKEYVENPGTLTTPVATGTNAIAFGSGSSATIWGQQAWSNDRFATSGDSQKGSYILRAITTTATPTTLFLDTAGTQSLVLPNNSVWTFNIYVAARRTDTTGGGAGYKFEGVARKDTTSGSVTFVGSPSKTVLGETNAAWDAVLSVNTTTGGLQIQGTGEAAKTIRWVAVVETTEVTN